MIAANEAELRKMSNDLALRGEAWVDENGFRIEPAFVSPEHERLVRHYERVRVSARSALDRG